MLRLVSGSDRSGVGEQPAASTPLPAAVAAAAAAAAGRGATIAASSGTGSASGSSLLLDGQYERSIEAFDRARAMDPDSPRNQCQWKRGISCYFAGRFEVCSSVWSLGCSRVFVVAALELCGGLLLVYE